MKKALVGFALSLATAMPVLAGSVYVVVLEPSLQDGTLHSTEVWVANGGTAQKPFFSTFLAAETDGVQRKDAPTSLPVPIGRTFLLANVGSINGAKAGLCGLPESFEERRFVEEKGQVRGEPRHGGREVHRRHAITRTATRAIGERSVDYNSL